ncbi:putative zinc-type alcohol dehydrogenase-like protein C16A3.02c [Viridothelium virens]|uniref:Putative zinc-type alcohol dehydrogenase-like protein C16A3.02c n=1 Tax=Viridothelium virens TaxID=1048519 RepID=A0A6A6H9S9_VIRVR|nr:putative zinc-type alcohol dehydrogenase-like protein C16A3.02c [Viridothelium virens]
MRAWQYTATRGGLENNLKLNASAPVPVPKDPSTQHVIQVLSVCLNPVDYKVAELIPSAMLPKRSTPGIDFVGKVATAARESRLVKGDTVFGIAALSPLAGGALADYVVVPMEGAAKLPPGVEPIDAATLGVAGLSAYQAIVPYVKAGDKIFINGGSGGVGIFSIQIAKNLGCYVITSCSTANINLCRTLGADEVIDYKKGSVLEMLRKCGDFNHIVDNVGNDFQLYWQAHTYSGPSAKFVGVAGGPSLRHLAFATATRLWPGFLGGGRRQFVSFLAQPKLHHLQQMGTWMAEGKIKAIIDSKFPFDKALDAFRRLKTERARGKIVINVAAANS